MVLDKTLEYLLLFFFSITDSYGLSIILLSFAVTVIMLPLFWGIEKLQLKDRRKKALMQDELNKIKNLNNKQEKYFYTREIYKKNNYNPYSSLVGLLGLLIQIPFFIAAYVMLENFEGFNKIALGPITDLSQADGMILIRGVFINVLPLLMTASNLLSIKLYSKNTNYKEKGQLILIA
ncbi:MAG: YidC/Oxa1 family membrane protein insertase, partial [Bacteroidales bacterium]|nr:YidC/Oxa1 family membrane protein insertase [Bacteroidales bacterium]